MITESFNLIGQKHILVDNLEIYVINDEDTFVSLEMY